MYAPSPHVRRGSKPRMGRRRQSGETLRADPPAAPPAVAAAAPRAQQQKQQQHRALPLDPPPPADPRRDRPWRRRKKSAPKKRPSFAEQLAAATASASDVTRDLCERHGAAAKPKQLLSTSATRLTVGRLASRSPRPIAFFDHHLVLTFVDPRTAGVTIKMAVAYSDMIGVTLETAATPCQLRFRVAVPLSHFSDDVGDSVVIEMGALARASGALATLQRVIERNVDKAPRRGKGARYTGGTTAGLRTTTTCTLVREKR